MLYTGSEIAPAAALKATADLFPALVRQPCLVVPLIQRPRHCPTWWACKPLYNKGLYMPLTLASVSIFTDANVRSFSSRLGTGRKPLYVDQFRWSLRRFRIGWT